MRNLLACLALSAIFVSLPAFAQVAPRLSQWATPDVFPPKPAPPGADRYLALLTAAGTKPRVGVLCGGTAIADNWVLTAAHCAYDENCALRADNGIGVRTGAIELDKLDLAKETYSSVIVVHPSFKCITKTEEARRLRAGEALPIGGDIALIYVPGLRRAGGPSLSSRDASEKMAPPLPIRVLGWGKVEPSIYANSLQMVELAMSEPKLCADAWKPTTLTSDVFCGGRTASDASAGSCIGDSGGPVLGAYSGQEVQYGIVSAGNETCGQMNRPTIFTKVGLYEDWIVKYTGRSPFQSAACKPPAC
jgi:secreted trypsin-like serine protease